MLAVDCNQCSVSFMDYPSHINRRAASYCSRQCAWDSKKGKPSYVRTSSHRAKMSVAIKRLDLSSRSKRLTDINRAKKGKMLQELYPDKWERLLESLRQQTGDRNPNWKGGKHRDKYPYIFYKLRQTVLDMDWRTCRGCDMTEAEARAEDALGRGLTIHHIDYNKENNDLNNLITLCKRCNSKANRHREIKQQKYSRMRRIKNVYAKN